MKKLIILSPSEIEITNKVAMKITMRGKDNVSKALRYIINKFWEDHRKDYE